MPRIVMASPARRGATCCRALLRLTACPQSRLLPERIPIPLKPSPAQEQRIRQLFKLIADEKDPEKVQVLAGELARLITVQAPLRKPSDQQLRIIEPVAQGLKNREIADKVGLRSNVVKNYIGQIYHQVGVKNRVELALWYETRVHE
jgi:DNA-binding NarL/FixJ family response regulator